MSVLSEEHDQERSILTAKINNAKNILQLLKVVNFKDVS